MSIFSVCENPPEIDNGTYQPSETVITEGTTLNYNCNPRYFAHGENSEVLSTECLGNGLFSVSKENLATCALICQFCIFCTSNLCFVMVKLET